MNRRGFALLAVLWVLTALTVLTGVALGVAWTGELTTRNRVLLARVGWAREACLEILIARYAQANTVRRVDTVDLGRGTWCTAAIEDPAARLNINLVDREPLVRLLSAVGVRGSVGDSVIAFRRRGPIYDIRQVHGVDSEEAAHLAQYVTTRGTGVVAINTAPREVLATLPGMTEEAIEAVVFHRQSHALRSVDELVALLSPSARAAFSNSYSEFARVAEFTPEQLEATVVGGVRGSALRSRALLTVVPTPSRLAVTRRVTE